jgi:hypothetical protein
MNCWRVSFENWTGEQRAYHCRATQGGKFNRENRRILRLAQR